MKNIYTSAILILVSALLLAACGLEGEDPGAYSGTLILSGQHSYQSGAALDGVLILLDGEASLEPGARLNGQAFVLGGILNIDGEIQGDVSVIGGEINIGPQAEIGGDVRVGSGDSDISPQAQVNGQVLVGSASGVEIDELLPQRSTLAQLIWLLPEALVMGGLAYLAARYIPRQVNNVRNAAVSHPVISAAMGLLASIVLPALLVLMAYTLILVPVTALGLAIGFLIVGYGYVALGIETGRRLVRWRNWELSPNASAALGTLVFTLFLNLFNLVPVMGPTINLIIAIVVIGAVMLTRFGLYSYSPPYEA